MRVVPKGERLHGEGKCFICESYLNVEADRNLQVIDTFREFDPPFQHPLVGPKLLCNNCVEEAAILLGFASAADTAEAKIALEEARRKMSPLQERIVSLTDEISREIHGAVDLPVFDVPDAVTDKAKENK